MRLVRNIASLALFSLLGLTALAGGSRAQNPDSLDPEQSAAKADQLLKQLINAMGGSVYMQAQGQECGGRFANFGHNGATNGYMGFKSYWQFPDKFRIDYSRKDNIIDLFAGDQGWTLDRGGVSEEPATSLSDFQDALNRDVNYVLRYRLPKGGYLKRYGGSTVASLREVDIVELTDPDDRKLRLAIDKQSHLLVKLEVSSIVPSLDEVSRERRLDVVLFTNYQLKDGVQLPMQVTRERDGRRVYQAFYDSCQMNPNLPSDFFTKAALEKRFAELGGKKK